MPHIVKIEGFVLKKRILLEQDILVTVFTQEFGKVTAMAKGARKITSRRSAHLQTGNLINLNLSESHDMYYIQSSELISGFMQIKNEKQLNIRYLFFFILDKLLPERQEELPLYKLTKHFCVDVSAGTKEPALILRDTLQKTLQYLGYVQDQKSLQELLQLAEDNIEEKLPRNVIM